MNFVFLSNYFSISIEGGKRREGEMKTDCKQTPRECQHESHCLGILTHQTVPPLARYFGQM